MNGTVKLSDFGMAKKHIPDLESLTDLKGTLFFMAPEIFLTDRRLAQRLSDQHPEIAQNLPPQLLTGYSYPCDIWAFAITVFQLLTGRPLYHNPGQAGGINPVKLLAKILAHDTGYEARWQVQQLAIVANARGIFDFFDAALRLLPESRPSASELAREADFFCLEHR